LKVRIFCRDELETVADFKEVATGRSTLRSRNFFRFFPAKMNEKRVYIASNEPQNVIFAYDCPLFRKVSPLSPKILYPSLFRE
jgi:hypothetical protein